MKVLWRDGTESSTPLKYLKQSNPVEVAEFEKDRDLESELALYLWIPHVPRKRDVITSNVASRSRKTTHNHGVEMPNECYEHVLLHADDTLVASENAESVLRDRLGKNFELKQESIVPPKFYFSGSFR